MANQTVREKLISFVIPVYNEGTNVRELYERLTKILAPLMYRYEFIFVDDGSEDQTLSILETLHGKDSRVKYVSFSRNFGHQNALTAGLDHAKGDAIISMDGDLQHPPELVSQLIEWWKKGYEIVYTYRHSTQGTGWFKRWTAALFYKLINTASQVKIEPNTSDFRLIDRKVADVLCAFKVQERFYRGLIKWVGFSQKRLEFNAPSRFSGARKYTLVKMLRFAARGFLTYSYLPLYSVIALCFIFIALSFAYGLFAMYQKFVTQTAIPGQASLLMTQLVVASVELFVLAVISFYMLKIYHGMEQRPVYVIRQTKGIGKHPSESQENPIALSESNA